MKRLGYCRDDLKFIFSGLFAILVLARMTSAQSGAQPATIPSTQNTIRLPATVLLEGVRKQYATARSYADEGEVTELTPRAPFIAVVTKFKTRFARSGGFAFRSEYAAGAALPTGVWLQDGRVWHTDFDGHIESMEDLAAAMSGMAGVSRTASARVPPLLMPQDLFDPFSWNPDRASIDGEEVIKGVTCIRIVMKDEALPPAQIWIGRDDKLIYQWSNIMSISKAVIVIDFRPRMNIDIDPKEMILDQVRLPPTTANK